MAKLHDYYKSSVVAELTKEFSYTSVMQVPRIEKITLNMGVGEAINDKKLLENAAADMATIPLVKSHLSLKRVNLLQVSKSAKATLSVVK